MGMLMMKVMTMMTRMVEVSITCSDYSSLGIYAFIDYYCFRCYLTFFSTLGEASVLAFSLSLI